LIFFFFFFFFFFKRYFEEDGICRECDESCKSCKGGGKEDCLSCWENDLFEKEVEEDNNNLKFGENDILLL
jgi:hypothetical protein